jgi:hypothetical protein
LVETVGQGDVVMVVAQRLRLLGAIAILLGIFLGAGSVHLSRVGALLAGAAALVLVSGRGGRLQLVSLCGLFAVAVQTASLTWAGLSLVLGALLFLPAAIRSERLNLTRYAAGHRRLLLCGSLLVLCGLLLPWNQHQGVFAGGYTHLLDPLTGDPRSVYDPLAAWIQPEVVPGRHVVGALLPLLALAGLLILGARRPRKHPARPFRRIGLPLCLGLLLWWLSNRPVAPGGLLYLAGALLILAALRKLARNQATRATRAPGRGPRSDRLEPPARREHARG